ncbi:MAG: PQQ-dependent sugar dehydrogenase [Gemmatimonadota bacterium]|nr:PQQ-dependent sugar dehydrogenase [Gemmatimonadota bacterium]
MTSRTILTSLVFWGLAGPAAAQETYSSDLHDFRVVPVASGLEHPWSIAFLPSGDILATERPGRLRVIRDGRLHPDPIAGVPDVRARGQGGLLEVALHPDFETNRLVYLTFSKPNRGGSEATTAVVRGRFDGHALSDLEEIFEAEAWSRGGNHFGSKLAFDRDGHLFVTVGDRGASPFELGDHPAQHLTNHQGKVLRLHDDGRVPADNPFVGQDSALPEIWSFGHRNLQGLAFHPETGDLWETEHGPQGGDELNLVRPARNYGWPVIGYGVQYGGRRIHDSPERAGMEQPVHYWVPSIATSGLLIYSGDRFPHWRGSAFVGGLSGAQIARVTLDGREAVSEETLLRGFGRIRDIRQGPDGLIYLAIDTSGGSEPGIVRLEPVEAR